MMRLLLLVATAFFCLVSSRAAEGAPFVLHICDDVACAGGNDIVSNTGFYQSPALATVLPGWQFINVSAVRTGPNADDPAFVLDYQVRSVGPDPKTLWVYASNSDFTFIGGVGVWLDGGFSFPPGVEQAALYGGSSNLLFDMSNQLGATVPTPTSVWGGFEHVGLDVNPYSLTAALFISHPGAAEGRIRRSDGRVEVVPEPASLALMGGGIASAMLARRRRRHLR